jgi:hypothetical protein
MRTGTALRHIALAATASGLAVLTACSSGTSGTADGQGTHASADQSGPGYDSVESITRCLRQHGDPSFPDPVYDPSDGRWHFGTSPNSAPASARQACQGLFPSVNPSPPVPQAEFQELLRYARCMRQHGVHDWPDPNPAGDFALPPDLLTKTPLAVAASTACQRYVPSGGLNVSAG